MTNFLLKTLFGLIVLQTTVCGQQSVSYFNKTYGGNDTINILGQAIVPIDSGYIVFGNYSTPSVAYGLGSMKIDEQGNMLWFKGLEETSTFQQMGIAWGGESIKDDNAIMLLYSKQKDINLFKLTFNGDTLWRKRYSKQGWQSAKHITKTKDNGYLIAGGEENITADTVKAYVLKLDSLGNFEWDRYYTMGNDARFFTVQQTPWDSGYIFGGMGYSTATGYDMFVVKTDSIGDTLWTRRYGNTFTDWGTQIIPITTTQQYESGYPIQYILTGGWRDVDDDWEGKLYIAKLDSIGGIIWQKKHTNYAYFGSIQTPLIVRQGGRAIGVATFENWYNYPNPVIVSFNADGTIAWKKEVTLDPTKSSYIKDMRPTSDGGYVLAGYQYSSPQTAWVLKIDSLGNTCSFVGCDSTIYTGYPIGLDEVLLNKTTFSIVPNPTNNYFDVYLSNESIPNQQLSIYDINGRLLQTTAINGQHTLVNVAHLPSGMYYCKLSNDSSVQKLVIIK